MRQQLIFEKYGALPPADRGIKQRGVVGFNRSFLINTYYPLYSNFFSELGYKVILPQAPSQEGIDHCNAPFCYPVELAHGFFYSLIESNHPPDYIFLPHFKAVPDDKNAEPNSQSQVCPLVQGETFYLQSAFRKKLGQLVPGWHKAVNAVDRSVTGNRGCPQAFDSSRHSNGIKTQSG